MHCIMNMKGEILMHAKTKWLVLGSRKLISLTLTRLSIFLVARNNAVKVELTLATIPDLSKLVTSAYVVVEIILANVHRRIYKRAMTGFTPQSRCGH